MVFIIRIKKLLGKGKFYQNRINGYLSIVNAVNIILILSEVYTVNFIFISLVIMVIMICVGFFDSRFVNENDIDTFFNKSESFKNLCSDVEDIKKKLEK